jgi:hypothetical protein
MKRFTASILLIVCAGLLYISSIGDPIVIPDIKMDSSAYKNGILKSEFSKINNCVNYFMDVKFDPGTKSIYVKENITWINKTHFPASEIQLHFYANAYKSNKTLFAEAYSINSQTSTQIDIKSFLIDGKKSDLIFFQPEIADPNDSTVAKVLLDKSILPGDSAKIYFEYSLKIPISVKRFGAASGRNFYFVSQWFPKVGVFQKGEWVCSQYHPYLNYYSDFGDYSVKINVPNNYMVGATGIVEEKKNNQNSTTYSYVQSGVHDFVWMTSDEILQRNSIYTRKDGTKINILAFVQPEREKYFDRYFQCVKNCLEYFENHVGIYPYQNITLVDVPRTSASGGMEYPTLFTVSAELFSPKDTGWPEYLVAHEFSHQYFQGMLANNEVYEAWLDEGFASYMATKIMYTYQPEIDEYFKFANYIPVFGLNFLSYNEIPMIYTLADLSVPQGLTSAESYYKNVNVGSISDTSYKLPNRLSYVVNSYGKPELVLHTLERYVGIKTMMKILHDYYDECKYKHPVAEDFIAVVQKNCKEDMKWFFNEFYSSPKAFDYKITSINKAANNEYDVLVERLGDGIFKNDVALYTDKDTIYEKWNGVERWKILKFKTNNEVIAAEIDPHRKNLLDVNFANNSCTVKPRVWASLSLAIRLFFWIQNALTILGSIG